MLVDTFQFFKEILFYELIRAPLQTSLCSLDNPLRSYRLHPLNSHFYLIMKNILGTWCNYLLRCRQPSFLVLTACTAHTSLTNSPKKPALDLERNKNTFQIYSGYKKKKLLTKWRWLSFENVERRRKKAPKEM